MARAAASANPATAALRPSSDAPTPTSAFARKADTKPASTRREPQHAPESATAPDAPAPAKTVGPSFTSVAEPRPSSAPTASPAPLPAPLPPPPSGVDVSGALLRSSAHLKLEAGALGSVDLHLRIRDGAVHLRVAGEAAHIVETRSAELNRALASEGLKLGSVEVSKEGSSPQGGTLDQGEGRRQGWQEAADAREAAARTLKSQTSSQKPVAHGDSSIEVQA
jgi:flagellar hook-length control protein FliK